jgi:pimeloyl-ACP methyl ester carboxylesterase
MNMWPKQLNGQAVGLTTPSEEYDPALPGLLCIHGSGGTGDAFLPMLEHLQGVANGAAIDLPGHGATPGPGRNQVGDYTAWVTAYLELCPAPPVLLGNSLGGAIVLSMALEHPRLISGLVLWGTGARLRVLPQILDGLANDFLPTVDMLTSLAYDQDADPALTDEGRRVMAATAPEVLHGDYAACNQFDVMDRLTEIDLPTLVVCGEGDKLTPLKYSEFLRDRIKDAKLAIIAGAGHMIHHEQPKAGAEALGGFLQAL